MKKNYLLLLFFGALLLCACQKENIEPLVEDQAQLEESALKGAKKHAVPFKGEFIQHQLTEDWSGAPFDYHLTMEGEGTASHLGKTTILIDQHWNFTLPPPTYEPDAEAVGYGTSVLISANGDELYTTFESYNKVEIMGPDNKPVYIIVWGTGAFNEGTGRFADAIGEFTFSGDFVVADAQGKMVYKGTIKY